MHYFNYFKHYKYFYDSKANQAKYLTSLDVVFKDADVKSYYDLSNSERVVQRHIISILIIKGQFIDSLLSRKFSTQSLETRSHHLSI